MKEVIYPEAGREPLVMKSTEQLEQLYSMDAMRCTVQDTFARVMNTYLS